MSRNVRNYQKTYRQTCMSSEDSDQPAHIHRLIIIFIGRIQKDKDAEFPHVDNEDLADCANAQADISLRCAQMFAGTFSYVAGHMN